MASLLVAAVISLTNLALQFLLPYLTQREAYGTYIMYETMVSSKKVASSTYIVYERMVFSNWLHTFTTLPPTAYRLPLVFSGLLQAGDRVHLQHDLRALPARAAAGGPHAGE